LNSIIKELEQKIAQRKAAKLYRELHTTDSMGQNRIYVTGKHCLDFSSNDYLGLKNHPKINKALIKGCKSHGFGSGSSALVSGYSSSHKATEEKFSQWLGTDKAMLFSSGYTANIGIISALSKRTDTIFSDKLSHASILDGIILSRAKHCRYKHNDPKHLQELANKYPPNLIATESVFSMEGDIAPITEIADLAKQYHSGLVIDDAHGIGVLGKHGKGASEEFALNQNSYTCLVIPLGKAFNAMGAIVTGRKETIDALQQFSRSYCYSTALPAAICLAIQTTLDVIQDENWRQQQLKSNIAFFVSYALHQGLTLISNDKTPIQSIILTDNQKTLSLQKWLISKGLFVSAIRPPTVPNGTARLRVSINCLHTPIQITQLIDYIIMGSNKC
jgi:8-amino-7-oxononanoate synthase